MSIKRSTKGTGIKSTPRGLRPLKKRLTQEQKDRREKALQRLHDADRLIGE